jgi:hypothetical protein
MKKFFFIFVVIGLLLSACEKEKVVKPPDPPPVISNIKVTGSLDFPAPGVPSGLVVRIVILRNGRSFECSEPSMLRSNASASDFSVNLPASFNYLKGTTKEIVFRVDYYYNLASWGAIIIKPVTFTDSDTTDYVVNVDLGKIGFSDYDWFSVPKLEMVVLPSGEKYY